ncbi:MAG TPA: hypothetical protein GXX29_02770 [Firmicutes bacterium]|nr:hypothetical protein [Bacillota bacterium]
MGKDADAEMASIEEIYRRAYRTIRGLDPKTKASLRRRLARENIHDPAAIKRRIDHLDPVTWRRMEAKLGLRVSKAQIRAMDAATVARLVRRLKAALDD